MRVDIGPTKSPTARRHRKAARQGLLSVAGVAGGVGTTTVATALGAVDCGLYAGAPVGLLVCRAIGDSLIRAGRTAQLVAAGTGCKPVLAVTAADASGRSRPVTARLRLLEPHAAAVVVLPFVRRWRDLATPLDEVRGLLAIPRAEMPRSLRSYAAALNDLCAAMERRSPVTARPAVTAGRAAVPTRGRTP